MKFINGKTDYSEWYSTKKLNRNTVAKQTVINNISNENELTLAEELQLVNSLHLVNLEGKLEGYKAISTSVAKNPYCQCRAKINGCICEDCYAATSVSAYDGLAQALDINYDIMNNYLISETAWATLSIPTINMSTRIESHGDAGSVKACRNQIRIMNTHKHLTFGVWSKNLGFWKQAFELEGGKPSNMVFIASSPFRNKPMFIPQSIRPYVDHVFTVYTMEYAIEHNVNINCGLRKCKDCMTCYTIGNDTYYINEMLKADQKAYAKAV
jgi:hypothetical protein